MSRLTCTAIENGDIELEKGDKKASLETACRSCPNAVWHITQQEELRVYCLLMRSLIDMRLIICDGTEIPMLKEEKEA